MKNVDEVYADVQEMINCGCGDFEKLLLKQLSICLVSLKAIEGTKDAPTACEEIRKTAKTALDGVQTLANQVTTGELQ